MHIIRKRFVHDQFACILWDMYTAGFPKHCETPNHSEERLQIKARPGSDFWKRRNLRSRSRWQWQPQRKVLQRQASGMLPSTYCLAVLSTYFSRNAKEREEIATNTGLKDFCMCDSCLCVGRYNYNRNKLDPSCRYCLSVPILKIQCVITMLWKVDTVIIDGYYKP